MLHRAGSLSEVQVRFRDGVLALGHEHRVIRDVEAYADLLDKKGVPLRSRGLGVRSLRQPVALLASQKPA